MNRRSISTEAFDAVKRCYEAYGADAAKWPHDMRARYGALATSDEMAGFRKEAETLDGFLGAATAPRLSADLKNKIAAQYQPPTTGLDLTAIFSALMAQPRLIPAGALAGVGALGLATGMMTANAQIVQTPEYEAYAYLEYGDIIVNEEEAAQWDGD